MKLDILFTKGLYLNILNGLSLPYGFTDNIATDVFISAVEAQLELLQGQCDCSADCRQNSSTLIAQRISE
jgi:hypothetical protein